MRLVQVPCFGCLRWGSGWFSAGLCASLLRGSVRDLLPRGKASGGSGNHKGCCKNELLEAGGNVLW